MAEPEETDENPISNAFHNEESDRIIQNTNDKNENILMITLKPMEIRTLIIQMKWNTENTTTFI